MLNYNIRIVSLDAGNIFINGDFVGFIDNKENFSIDLKVSNQSLVITKEPISNKKKLLLPYTVIVKANSKLKCDSDYAKIVPFLNNNYDIILKDCEVKQNKKLEKVFDDYVAGYNLVVVNNGESFINLYNNNNLKYSCVINEITEVFAEKQNNYIIIKGLNKDNNKHIIILDEENNFNEVINTSAEQIDENDGEIKILTKIYDIAKHASITILNTENNELNKQYYAYLNNEPVKTDSAQLIPYAFLEAIKINNFSLAKSYLSDELSNNSTKEHLQAYFENLKEIHYNTHSTNHKAINYTLHCNEYKSYNFYISNNKISDIEEIAF